MRRVLNGLTTAGYRATRVSTTGGFLRRGNTTLLIGVEQQWLQTVLNLLRDLCHGNAPRDAAEGGVTVFVLNVERFEQA